MSGRNGRVQHLSIVVIFIFSYRNSFVQDIFCGFLFQCQQCDSVGLHFQIIDSLNGICGSRFFHFTAQQPYIVGRGHGTAVNRIFCFYLLKSSKSHSGTVKYRIGVFIAFPRQCPVVFGVLNPCRHKQMGVNNDIRISYILDSPRTLDIPCGIGRHNVHIGMVGVYPMAVGQVMQHSRFLFVVGVVVHMQFLIVHTNQSSRPIIRLGYIGYSKLSCQII